MSVWLPRQEVLQFIEDRLSELEQEKEELTDYEQLDKSRRALEYNIYDHELAKANQAFKELGLWMYQCKCVSKTTMMSELSRENEREQQQDLYNNIRDIQDSILVEDDQLTIARSAHDRILTRKLQRDDEMTAMKEKISLIEIEIFESISSKKNQELEFQQLTNVLNDVKRSIDHDEGVLIISPWVFMC